MAGCFRGCQRGVGEHPHKSFETAPVVCQGECPCRDSTGNAGVICPGDVQWLPTGSGSVHKEMHQCRSRPLCSIRTRASRRGSGSLSLRSSATLRAHLRVLIILG